MISLKELENPLNNASKCQMLSLFTEMTSQKWLWKTKENLKISKVKSLKNGWVKVKSYLPEPVQLRSWSLLKGVKKWEKLLQSQETV